MFGTLEPLKFFLSATAPAATAVPLLTHWRGEKERVVVTLETQ